MVLVGLPGLDESRLTPIPWFSDYAHLQKDRDGYDAALAELAEEHSCTYVKTVDLFSDKKDELLIDGLHPTAEGHRLIFERVKSELEQVGVL